MIEEVKKIAQELYDWEGRYGSHKQRTWQFLDDKERAPYLEEALFIRSEFCWSFEPKPKKQKLEPPPRFDEVFIQGVRNMDKPDEGRLLTDRELDKIADNSGDECLDLVENAIKAQRDLTASTKEVEWVERLNQSKDATRLSLETKDAGCQARVERIFAWVDENTKLLSLYMGEDLDMYDEWQALKKREGVK